MLAALLIFATGPLDEIEAARAAARSLPASTIFVTTLSVPPADLPTLDVAFNLALNGATFRRKPVRLVPVPAAGNRLYRIDAEELEWPAAAVRTLLDQEPYFRPFAPDVALVRIDWLAGRLTTAETYYALLGFGKTLADLDKRIGLDRKTAANLGASHGARVVESGVALNPRAIARLGSPLGGVWTTFDAADAAKVNPFEKIDRLTFDDVDAHELFGPLPNGLMWWALANGKGELQAAAPIAVALDRRTPKAPDALKDIAKEKHSFKRVEVFAPFSCLGCHAGGLRTANDFVSSAVAGGKLDVRTADKRTANAIEDFFDAKAQADAMRLDSAHYVDAVLRITGKPSADASAALSLVRFRYDELPVTAPQAAAEVGMTAEAFEKAAKERDAEEISSTLRAMVAGSPVPRDLWEKSVYLEAAAVAGCVVKVPSKPPPLPPMRKRAKDAATGRDIEFNEAKGAWEFVR